MKDRNSDITVLVKGMAYAAVLALGGCAPADNVRVSLYVPPSTSTVAARHGDPVSGMLSGMSGAMMLAGPPATVDGFDCLGVNVMGSGIQGNGYGGGGSGCDYPGVTSAMVPTATGGMIDFKVPSGPDRVFQMVGVATGSGCPGGTISDLMRTMPPGPPSPIASPTPPPFVMAQVGRAGPIALFKDTEVDIKNSYNASNPQQPFGGPNCGGGSPPPPPFMIGMVFPYGGMTAGGYTTTISGSGFKPTAVVTIGGNLCNSQAVVSSNQITCVVPAALTAAGSYPVVVDNKDGTPALTAGALFQIVMSGAFVSVDTNTNNTDFGSVAVGTTKDITVTLMNTGSTSAMMASTLPLAVPFSKVGGTCVFPSGTIATASASCTVIIRFSPTATGPFSNVNIGFTMSPTTMITFNGMGI